MRQQQRSFEWKSVRSVFLALALVVFVLGLGIRLLDLTDPPLDFHAWRQFRSATIARGMYYVMARDVDPEARQVAENLGSQFEKLEPPISERIVALAYLAIGQEILWIARLFAIIYWMIGGVALYALAVRISSHAGAALSLGFYLLLPFGIIASRSFQPEPLMVMWILLAAYATFRWTEAKLWRWAIAAGVAGGIAALVKVFGVFPVAAVTILLVLHDFGFRKAVRSGQVWAVAGLMIAIPASYYFVSTRSEATAYLGGWVFAFTDLLVSPSFYIRWATTLKQLLTIPMVIAGAMGILLLRGRGRLVAAGLWVGYFLISAAVPGLVITHSYYNLPLIPAVALSLSPFGDFIVNGVRDQGRIWKAVFVGVLVVAIGIPLVDARNDLLREDYRLEPIIWRRVGDSLPRDGGIIGLTHDYNTRLKYYGWIGMAQWPHAADFEMGVLAGGNYDPMDPAIVDMFEERTEGFDYFLVTLFTELEAQPILKDVLYSNYPFREGDGYVLFDLREGQ
ncbi:MAG: ArnT family glycosyltransferase [Anaerolineales bacterium]